MSFKDTICSWLGCCSIEKTTIFDLQKTIELSGKDTITLVEQIKSLQIANAGLQQDLSSVETELQDVTDDLKLCQQAYENPTNIPEKSIKYVRNIWLGQTKGWVTKPISVRLFITMNDDSIKDQIKTRKLAITDISKFDEMIPKIYLEAKKGKYAYDDGIGFKENWWFPWEHSIAQQNAIGSDCEDFSHNIVSWLRVAGVPADRVFVSCGTTRSGFGHSTVYIKRYLDNKWVHLNSTLPYKTKTNLKDYPLKDDETDSIGIHPDKFWFSFNDLISIQRFDTKEAEDFFNKEEAMKKVIIE